MRPGMRTSSEEHLPAATRGATVVAATRRVGRSADDGRPGARRAACSSRCPSGWSKVAPAHGDAGRRPTDAARHRHGRRQGRRERLPGRRRTACPSDGAVVVVIGWRDSVGGSSFLPLSAMKLRRGTFECFAGRGAVGRLTRRDRDFQVNVHGRRPRERRDDRGRARRRPFARRRPARRLAAAVAERREYRVAGQAEPISHFTDAVRAGDLLFVSGVVPVDAEPRARRRRRRRRPGARRLRQHASRCSPPPAATFADVVKVTVFLTDIDDRPLVNPVRQEVFGETRPASTLVEVSALVIPGARIEVDAVALVPA